MHRQRYQSVLMLILFSIFALCAALVLYYQIQCYHIQHNALRQDEQMYIAGAYLRNQLTNKEQGVQIYIQEQDEVPCFVITKEDMDLQTFIYVYDGWLQEQLLTQNAEFDLQNGEKISPMDEMIVQEETSLFQIHLKRQDHMFQIIVQRGEERL